MQKIILSLTLLFVANAYAESHNKTVFCAEQVYVKSQGTLLKEKPSEQSRTIMTLKPHQYLCVLNTEGQNGWTQVKKVPLLPTAQKALNELPEENRKTEAFQMADFPTKWQVRKPAGKKCKLTASLDEEQFIVKASGVCATGWVKTEDIQYFAD